MLAVGDNFYSFFNVIGIRNIAVVYSSGSKNEPARISDFGDFIIYYSNVG